MKISEMTPEQKHQYNAKRQKEFRARRRLAQDAALDEQRSRQMERADFEYRKRTGRCWIGEVSPGVDADNLQDALQVAREMARALRLNDVHQGESLYEFERRVWTEWVNKGGPLLVRETQKLAGGNSPDQRDYLLSFGGFEKCWLPLPGSNQPLDIESLEPLPPIPEIKPEPVREAQIEWVRRGGIMKGVVKNELSINN